MVLKFHMQHDEAAGLQNDKIQAGRNQIWPLLLKIANPLKSTFPPEPKSLQRTLGSEHFVNSLHCTPRVLKC